MQKAYYILLSLLHFFSLSSAQPFIDPVNCNVQYFSSTYRDSLNAFNQTTDYFFNLFFPKEFKNGNTFLARFNAEKLHSQYSSGTSYSSDLYSLALPVGMQFATTDKKWKALFMIIPKISTDFKDDLSNDLQLGGTTLYPCLQ